MCFALQRRAIFRHQNFKKCSEPDVLCTFWLANALPATAACKFPTSELQKSAPNPTCFVHFHLQMCFALQRHAILRHQNFKKCFGADVFCTFSLQSMLLATAACNFWCPLWPLASAPVALTGLLFDWPDTLTRHTNHWETRHFATSLTFGADVSSFFWLSRYCIFFLLTWLL